MTAEGLVAWHQETYGKRPALFLVRHVSRCCWCAGDVMPGDEGCYWPEHNASVAHADCLRVVWKSHL